MEPVKNERKRALRISHLESTAHDSSVQSVGTHDDDSSPTHKQHDKDNIAESLKHAVSQETAQIEIDREQSLH